MKFSEFIQRFIKYIICALSAAIMILGIIMLTVGGLVLARSDMYQTFLQEGFLSVPGLLLFMGSVLTFVFFLGCCGMLKSNRCMTLTFAVLLSILLVMGLGASIAAYTYRDSFEGPISKTMSQQFAEYNGNSTNSATIRDAFDDIQKSLKCCGVNGSKDYNSTLKIEPPLTCCINGTNCDTKVSTNLYSEGCAKVVFEDLKKSANLILSWNAVIFIIQLLCIVASCYLARSFPTDYETV